MSRFYLDFTPQQEIQADRELMNIKARNAQLRASATQQLAQTVGDMVRMAPTVQPHLALPVAKAVQSGVMTSDAAERLIMDVQKRVVLNPDTFRPNEKPSGAWDWIDDAWDWTFEKAKGTVKWTGGALMFIPELATNAVSSAVSSALAGANVATTGTLESAVSTSPFKDVQTGMERQATYQNAGANAPYMGTLRPEFGVVGPQRADIFDPYAQWRSTTLGTLVSGPDTGRGWWIGEEANKELIRYQKEVRGTVAGHAMTPGRGLAVLFAQPDTIPYSVLSGSIDSYLAFKIPSVPYGGVVSNWAKRGLSNIDIAKTGLSGSDEAVPFLRSLAGLTDGTQTQITRSRLPEFLDSAIGRWVQNKAVGVTTIEEARRLFPKADLPWWQEVVKATDDNVREIFARNLGIAPGLSSTRQINISRWADVKDVLLHNDFARWSGMERLASNRAGKEIWLVADNTRDLTKSVSNLIDYMRMLRFSPEERAPLINKLAETLTNKPEEFRNVAKEITDKVAKKIVTESATLGRVRVNEDVIRKLAEVPEQIRDGWATFGLPNPETGFPTVFGLSDPKNALRGKSVDGVEGMFLIADDMAMLSTEHRRIGMMLPDPDRVYRATSKLNFLFEKNLGLSKTVQNFGKRNMPIVALDFLQHQVWRTLSILTGGYGLRNMSESALRNMLAGGIKTGPMHPLEHIQSAIHGDFAKYIGDLEGNLWSDASDAISRKVYSDFLEATQGTIRETMGSDMLAKIAGQTGSWGLANSEMGALYIQGIADNIHLLANDPLVQRVAQGMPLGGVDIPGTVLHWLSTSKEGQDYLKLLQARHADKPAFNTLTGKYERVIIDWATKDNQPVIENIQKLVENYINPRIEAITANHPELRRIIETGAEFGKFSRNGQEFRAFQNGAYDIKGNLIALDYDEEFKRLIADVVRDQNYKTPDWVKYRQQLDASLKMGPGKEYVDKVVTRFFSEMFGKSEAFLNRSPAFRQFFYKQVDNLLDELAPGEAKKIVESVRLGHKIRFEERLDKLRRMRPEANGMFNYGDELVTPAEHQIRIAEATQELAERAAKFDSKNLLKFNWSWPEQYVGSKELWKRIVDKAEGRVTSNGEMTAEQLNIASKSYAFDETKALFYNAAESNNMATVLRIIVPFGKAWAEVMKNWTRMIAHDPESMKKTIATVRGVRSADPDADGRGFVYTDPITGEQVFNYPASQYTIPALLALGGATVGGAAITPLGIGAAAAVGGAAGLGVGIFAGQKVSEVSPQLTAPAKSLSMGLNFLPGFGPVVQIGSQMLGNLLGNKPSYDSVAKLITPYGAPKGVEGFLPSWAQKFSEAISADPENDTIYLSNYVEAYSTLFASGKYDRQDDNQMQALDKEAQSIARWLTVIRSVGQFVGPSRPTVQFKVPTKYEGELTVNDVKTMVEDGNVANTVLGRAFRELQDKDYETAIPKFLEMFGWNLYMYVNGKSYSVSQGLSASKEFGDWERSNTGVRERHPEVYGYFATVGTDFDFQTYLRQFQTGDRKRWTDPKAKLEDAEAVVGNALYQAALREAGPDIDDSERAKLNKYKTDLYKEYPGYQYRAVDIRRTPITIARLQEAAFDEALNDNNVAKAARAYFQYRDEALGIANDRRDVPKVEDILAGEKNKDLRQELRAYGERLVSAYPEFSRMWSNVLLYEVDEV